MASAFLVLPADPASAPFEEVEVFSFEMQRRYALRGLRITPALSHTVGRYATPAEAPDTAGHFPCHAEELGPQEGWGEEVEELLEDWLSWPAGQGRVLLARG